MTITINKIAETDLADVVSLMREFAEYEKLTDYLEATTSKLDAAMFGDNAFVSGLIALDGDRPVGYALFHPNFSSFRCQVGMYLEDIYLSPECRGQGVGEAMLKQIAKITRQMGGERIDFQVLDWNKPAIDFYKKLGAVCNADETHFKFTDLAFNNLAA